MLQRSMTLAKVAVLLVLASVSFVGRGEAQSESQGLVKEVEALKQGQKVILQELQAIRELLMGKRGAAPADVENIVLSLAGTLARGDAKATVALVEFGDYQCPFCARHFSQTLPQLISDYVKTGKIRYFYRDFPLESIHPEAFKAAEATHCAGDQGKSLEMHERLLQNQRALSLKDLPGHAKSLELDVPKFQQCLDSGKHATQVRQSIQEGQKFGVTGTPAFFLGTLESNGSRLKAVNKIVGAQPYSAFQQRLDTLLSSANKDRPKDKSQ